MHYRLAVYFQVVALIPIALMVRFGSSSIVSHGACAALHLASCVVTVFILVSLLAERPRRKWTWAALPLALNFVQIQALLPAVQ